MQIRILSAADAAAFQAMRLRSLKEHPTAFGSSYEDEAPTPIDKVAERMTNPIDNPIFGAFVDDTLVGIAGLARPNRVKTGHRAMIWGMYVAPEARGKGAGRALLEALIAHGRTLPQLDEVYLAVTVGNETARRLYLGLGFAPYMIEPRYLKIDGAYYDLEWMSLRLR